MADVKIGQVWKEQDKRRARFVRVLAVKMNAAEIISCNEDGSDVTPQKRKNSARLGRFGSSKGYKLHRDASDAG